MFRFVSLLIKHQMRSNLILLFLILTLGVSAQPFPEIRNDAFSVGEKLKYKIKYGFMTAAEAVLEVNEGKKEVNGRKTYHLVASGKTTSGFDFFMRVRNRYDSYIDQSQLMPYMFTENIREGNYKRNSYVNFDHAKKKVITNKGIYPIPANTLDVISAFYYSRCVDVRDLRKGDKFKLEYFLDDGVYPLTVEYIGKETITTESGTFDCIKFSPELQPGRVFRKDSKMYLWISNDANRIPLKVEVEILIGSLVLELESYSGLRHEVTSRK